MANFAIRKFEKVRLNARMGVMVFAIKNID